MLFVSLDADVVIRCGLVALLALLLSSRDVGDVTGDVIWMLYAAAVLYDGGDAV